LTITVIFYSSTHYYSHFILCCVSRNTLSIIAYLFWWHNGKLFISWKGYDFYVWSCQWL